MLSELIIVRFGRILEFLTLFPVERVCGSPVELVLLSSVTSPNLLTTTHGRPRVFETLIRGMDPGVWTFWIKVSKAGLGVLLNRNGLAARNDIKAVRMDEGRMEIR